MPFLLLASGRNSPNSILILLWRITGPYSVGLHTTDRDQIHAIGSRCRAGVVAAEVGGTSKYFFVRIFNSRQEDDDDARKRMTPLVLLSPSRSPNRNDNMPSFWRRRVKRKRDNDKKRTSLECSLLFPSTSKEDAAGIWCFQAISSMTGRRSRKFEILFSCFMATLMVNCYIDFMIAIK